MKKINRFCIVANTEKDIGYHVAKQIKSYLTEHGKSARIVSDAIAVKGEEDMDLAIILGGDGTMIQAAKALTELSLPMMGINLGTLGFLTEIEKPNMFAVLDEVMEGNYNIQERIALTGTARTGNEKKPLGLAVNDCIIGKRGFGRMITTSVYVNDELVDNYVADGVLIATPTGSTAYNLSAGGPVLSPAMEGIIITPICPHSLNKRSIVVSADDRIKVCVGKTREEMTDLATVSVDGQLLSDAETNDTIEIEKAKKRIQVVRVSDTGFFERMRSKLNRK